MHSHSLSHLSERDTKVLGLEVHSDVSWRPHSSFPKSAQKLIILCVEKKDFQKQELL